MSIISIYEPLKNDMFEVEFEKEFSSMNSLVKKTSGIKYSDNTWQDITIIFYTFVNPNINYYLAKYIDEYEKKNFSILSFNIKSLDDTGVSIEKFEVNLEKILFVDFGAFGYENTNSIRNAKLIIKPRKVQYSINL